ncbi:MAG: glycosyltransferase family 39 protein [Acidobacteriota bacterium]|nr:glycosyltransferase family 39 protein [Blastocatellia bacterium]MDW8412488.1 glycosyltransferase family 39 protein [Acidobacteriota bacterium]
MFLREHRYTLLLFLFIPYFVNLGANSLWDGNEGFYAEPPREMLETGDWLVPTYNYVPRFKKPPLTTWIIGASYKLFGVSEFSERLPIAVASVLTILLTYLLAQMLYGQDAALLAAVILATTLKFMVYSRQFAGDIFLTLFITCALTCFTKAMLDDKSSRLYPLLGYTCIAFGILDKGIVAAVIPLSVTALFLLLIRYWSHLKLVFDPLGYLMIILIGLPWYLLMTYRYGLEFVKVNILQETVMRYVSDALGSRAIDYYLWIYFAEASPWSIFIVPVFIYWAKWLHKEWKRVKVLEISLGLQTLPLVWFAFVLVFFSLSVGKRAVYIVPLYPASAILIANYFTSSLYNGSSKLRFLHKAATLTLAAACFISSAAVFIAHKKLDHQTKLTYLCIGTLLLIGLSQIWVIIRKSFEQQALLLGMTSYIFIFSLTLLLPSLEYYRPIPHFAEVIKQNIRPEDEVGTFLVDTPSLMFYTRRKIFECSDYDEMLKKLDQPNQVYFVTRADYFEQLQARTPIPLQIIDSKPLLQLRLENFFGQSSSSPTKHLILAKKKS